MVYQYSLQDLTKNLSIVSGRVSVSHRGCLLPRRYRLLYPVHNQRCVWPYPTYELQNQYQPVVGRLFVDGRVLLHVQPYRSDSGTFENLRLFFDSPITPRYPGL
jgi:hypothetical protein